MPDADARIDHDPTLLQKPAKQHAERGVHLASARLAGALVVPRQTRHAVAAGVVHDRVNVVPVDLGYGSVAQLAANRAH